MGAHEGDTIRYCTDIPIVITHQDNVQCASKDREEADCKLINIVVNTSEFTSLQSN